MSFLSQEISIYCPREQNTRVHFYSKKIVLANDQHDQKMQDWNSLLTMLSINGIATLYADLRIFLMRKQTSWLPHDKAAWRAYNVPNIFKNISVTSTRCIGLVYIIYSLIPSQVYLTGIENSLC